MVASEPVQSGWPTETNLLFFPGTKKVMLTVQHPTMCTIIQDAFEQVRKGLLFKNAFPDTWVALDFTRDGLLAAAESHSEGSDIHNRLLCDSEYMFLMTRLVSFLFFFLKESFQFFFSLVHISRFSEAKSRSAVLH